MLAQRGDDPADPADPEEMEIVVEETRTIRLLDRTEIETEGNQDGARGEVDVDGVRIRAEGMDRDQDAKKRGRDGQ